MPRKETNTQLENTASALLDFIVDNFSSEPFNRKELREGTKAYSKGLDSNDQACYTKARFGKSSLALLVREGALDYDAVKNTYELNLGSPFVTQRLGHETAVDFDY